jgi:hypothetical protein
VGAGGGAGSRWTGLAGAAGLGSGVSRGSSSAVGGGPPPISGGNIACAADGAARLPSVAVSTAVVFFARSAIEIMVPRSGGG